MGESITLIVIAVITAIVGPSTVAYIKSKLTKKKRVDDLLTSTLHVSDQIVSKLEEIQDYTKSDRIWIIQFHNGGHFYPTGKSIQKFSMFYELLQTGVNSIQNNFQNIPVNLFSKLINAVYDKEVIAISDYKDITIATYGFKYIAEDMNIKSDYMFALKTLDNKFVGILGVSYTKRKHTLTEQELHLVETEAAAIGSVICKDLGC